MNIGTVVWMCGYGYFIITCILGVCIFIGFNLPEDTGLSFVNPKNIYKTGKVNWFGAYFLGILFSLIFLPSSICYWIYKLCTVRK